jgi:hypothetical protein
MNIPERDLPFVLENTQMVEKSHTPCLILISKQQDGVYRTWHVGHGFFSSRE